MHGSHSHSHDHHTSGISSQSKADGIRNSDTQDDRPHSLKSLLQKPRGRAAVIAFLFLVVSAAVKRKFNRLDFVVFGAFTLVLSLFDTAKEGVKAYLNKLKLLRDGVLKHSAGGVNFNMMLNEMNNGSPRSDGHLADRVTLLGVAINILLSGAKFFGGIVFNSAVLVADAGHSLSDLLSDFITLYAVQIARLPADNDHPYGHGKFESIGSLFLSLTLLATGVSVGSWSYQKMLQVILAQSQSKIAAAVSTVPVPSWPALLLAGISIASKEWLFQITKRVGESLNSQILIANAWHHRSDSFSSVLSLGSIATAILFPGLLVADSAAGILVAGMICLTGVELTDASDEVLVGEIVKVSRTVEGVRDVRNIRARAVGSGNLVDMTVLTDVKLSSSAAHAIAERTRFVVMDRFPQEVLDVLVRTQTIETVCPLLSRNQKRDVRSIVARKYPDLSTEISRITVHYINPAMMTVDILLAVPPLEGKENLSFSEVKKIGEDIKNDGLNMAEKMRTSDSAIKFA
eukprot:gene23053-31370_t